MGDFKDHLYALIFCGGGGTRLWPFSREVRPKQFLKVKGDKTLIRETFERVSSFIPKERIFVVTVPDYTDEVAVMLPEVPRAQVLVEPARRNTAMAAGLGAIAISKKDPVAIV
ncbi:MAG: sugar phosphate nucleotidyltransferase, partial [Patescibacteria group bacterium]